MLPYTDDDPARPKLPPITIAIAALTTLTFIVQLRAAGPGLLSGEIILATARIFLEWGFTPATATDPGSIHRYLTYTLLHVSIVHLSANLLFLWTFGPTIEGRCGSGPYILLYAGAAATAAISHAAANTGSPQPLVGASGAVSALAAAYVTAFPGNRITLLAPPPFKAKLQVPAPFLVAAWLALQLAQALAHPPSAEASWAHLGGLAAGAAPALAIRLLHR